MLRVIRNQRGDSSRLERATKRVLLRISPTRKGQVLESRNTIRNPIRPPPKKPQPLQPSRQLVVSRRLSHGSPVPLRILPRFLKRNRIGVGIITYARSVVRMVIHSESVLKGSLWRNLRSKRVTR